MDTAFTGWDGATYARYGDQLVKNGGPEPAQYADLDEWICHLYFESDFGRLNGQTLPAIRRVMAPVLSPATMHGWAYCKPHGYAGDFEIIDRHYLSYVCAERQLANWDRYWQAGPAACAVRNRKAYFHELLHKHLLVCNGRAVNVLNLASGPARDVFEFLSNVDADVRFDCVDHDRKAIDFASNLCRAFADRVTFIKSNVVRLHRGKQYDLIWAAGLFDYFNDSLFKRVLRRLLASMAPEGELVIGNFSPKNPNIAWLRFVEWHLHHRSEGQLRGLAIESGVHPNRIRIGQEPQGVNLFLHIHNGELKSSSYPQLRPPPKPTTTTINES
jgi:hypothetical protein